MMQNFENDSQWDSFTIETSTVYIADREFEDLNLGEWYNVLAFIPITSRLVPILLADRLFVPREKEQHDHACQVSNSYLLNYSDLQFRFVLLFFTMSDVHQPLSQIRISLAGSLGTGQIIFLAGIGAKENTVRNLNSSLCEQVQRREEVTTHYTLLNLLRCTSQGACVTVAALMQYFLMAAFCWMLVEGIYLYLLVVKVYNIENRMRIYHVTSWGKFLSTLFHQCQFLYTLAICSLSLCFYCRISRSHCRHVAEYCCRKRWNPEFCR